MRALIAAAAIAVGVVLGGSLALATTQAGPTFGVYTANEVSGGSTHLEASIHVTDPPNMVALTFQCGRPTGSVTVTEVWNSPPLPLRGGKFSFDARATISRLTLSATNAILRRTSYTSVVDVNGHFASGRGFLGALSLGGSPCGGTGYEASRLAGPTLTSPTP